MNRLTKALCAAAAIGSVLTLTAASQAADCVTDMDCPGSECGGQVCQWLSSTNHVCQDAGSKSHGSDGWCNTIADCKCQSVGAQCNAQFSCSFVLAADAPAGAGAGGTSSAGAGGTAGASAGGSSNGAAATGGDAPSSAGANTSGAGANATGAVMASPNPSQPDGPITGSPSAPEASGCMLVRSIAGSPERPGTLYGLALAATGLVLFRRRAAR